MLGGLRLFLIFVLSSSRLIQAIPNEQKDHKDEDQSNDVLPDLCYELKIADGPHLIAAKAFCGTCLGENTSGINKVLVSSTTTFVSSDFEYESEIPTKIKRASFALTTITVPSSVPGNTTNLVGSRDKLDSLHEYCDLDKSVVHLDYLCCHSHCWTRRFRSTRGC
jgi:hypothetical protein